MLDDGDLKAIAAIVLRIVAAELDRRNLKRSPDVTAAERMRRYRARKAKVDRNVTATGKRNALQGKSVTLRNTAELPDWLPLESWQAFIQHRNKIKRPMTDEAQRLAVKTLLKIRADGYDPQAVIEQSIMQGWQGLFPVRDDFKQGKKDGFDAWLARHGDAPLDEKEVGSGSTRE